MAFVTEVRADTAEILVVPELAASRAIAVRDVWKAFWSSRVLVWVAGIVAVIAFGWSSGTSARLDPLYFTHPFSGTFGNLLAAPAARFDSAWYLAIAQHGYEIADRAAFFPVYPALTALGGNLVGSALIAGVLISSALGFAGLYLVHRLVSLDFDLIDARNTVWIMAWFPAAFVLSAVYSESLYLVASLGAIYAGRLGKWHIAGLLGALAAGTRSTGVLVLLPLLFLYLYGTRADRPRGGFDSWRPRHHLRPDVLWLGLVPLGVLAYMAYLGIAIGDPMAAFTAQAEWGRALMPLGAIALGAWEAFRGVVELIPGVSPPGGPVASQFADPIAIRSIVLFGFLILGLWLLVQSWRRLPRAYTVYAIAGLALPLSMPAPDQALMSLPRFMLVLFPLWIALALWARERNRMRLVIGSMAPL